MDTDRYVAVNGCIQAQERGEHYMLQEKYETSRQ